MECQIDCQIDVSRRNDDLHVVFDLSRKNSVAHCRVMDRGGDVLELSATEALLALFG